MLRRLARRLLPERWRGVLQGLLTAVDHRKQYGCLFDPSEIAAVHQTYFEHGPESESWKKYKDAHLRLPIWFKHGLDPIGGAFAAQQHRLWRLISGVSRDYEPDTDEKEHDVGPVDAVRRPGYFIRRDAAAIANASDHVIATGMLLKHCGLLPGQWALEYGAGFGQTALALSRLGVNVDTVDISPTFCESIRLQAEFFQTSLTPFVGRFGDNPRPGRKYDLIWFYESFHHCLDFRQVVNGLHANLAEGGRVILGGEPVAVRENPAVPYPWGLRLHSETVAIVRHLHWFELGFSEAFLFRLFRDAGFVGERIDCEPSLFGRLHVFRLRDVPAGGLPAATDFR